MNKTISVNLSGAIFNIEEEAYQLLKNYLERIKGVFAGDPGEGEIMSDIESRIAELFQQRIDLRKTVIERRDVEEIVVIMGQPEDYEMADVHAAEKAAEKATESKSERVKNNNRRVYRDKDDNIIGGVCSGLSHYFGWDPLILRLIFAITLIVSFGTSVLVYIIFWAVVPAAETTAEKLQMRGEPVTVENIRKFVNDEAQHMADGFKNATAQTGEKISRRSNEVLSLLGTVLSKIVGVVLLLMGIGILFGLIGGLITADINVLGAGAMDLNSMDSLIFNGDGSLYWLIAGGLMLILPPCVMLVYAGTKLLFGIKRKLKVLGLTMLGLFVIGLLICTISGWHVGRQYASETSNKSEHVFNTLTSDTLFVSVNDDVYFPHVRDNWRYNDEFFELVKFQGDSVVYGEPVELNFYDTDKPNFTMEVIRSSNGPNTQEAYRKVEQMRYDYAVQGDSVMLNSWFMSPLSDGYRGQEVEINIYVPVGKYVNFGRNISRINWHHDYEGKSVLMGSDGWSDNKTTVIFSDPLIEVTTNDDRDSTVVKVGDMEIRTSN